MNFRVRYTEDYIRTLMLHGDLLTEWEREFLGTVKNVHAESLSTNQFNKLKEISEEVRARHATRSDSVNLGRNQTVVRKGRAQKGVQGSDERDPGEPGET